MNFFNEYGLSQDLIIMLSIDITIAILLLVLMRYLSGWSIKVNSTNELAERDNFAFGISTAGSIAAMGIVLTGAITGAAGSSYLIEAIGMSAYGIAGLVLIRTGRFIHDKLALNEVDKNAQILDGNVSIALVDASASIATALIIRSVLLWAEGLTIDTLVAVVSVFFISQMLFVLLTRMREYTYRRGNQGDSLQEALGQDSLALAIRHSGYLISLGLTFKAASYFLIYDPKAYAMNLFGWLTFSVVMLIILNLLLALVKRLVLANIEVNTEVEQQHNIGIATVEMAISIAVALLLTSLMV
ncbi:DUF350 domain-containing protein [Shewanella sp. NIFS-20-20]|uniref:DUF350 domain-containing protein n=1 Tax=Shewanella sp. NIFS-20-20 TaxID=2853806 RepID=UPI001C43E85D|nr:DUF350 domain-containing protein [Shewanella sp. NIFS-20-20]MBV7314686.1 DUF350 domain-containing protein [Shewanella sp. NIFS-20-20]